MQPNNQGGKWLTLIIVILIILVGGYYLLTKHVPSMAVVPQASAPTDSPIVTDIDVVHAPNANKLPSGFPSDIPVEPQTITKSTSILYPQKKTTNYFVAYTSLESAQTKYTEYDKYMISSGFAGTNRSTSTPMILQGTKGSNQLSVLINPQGKGSSVQISLVNQQ